MCAIELTAATVSVWTSSTVTMSNTCPKNGYSYVKTLINNPIKHG